MTLNKRNFIKNLALVAVPASLATRLAASTTDDFPQSKIIALILSTLEQLKGGTAKPGFIQPFAGTQAPKGWAFCDGAVLNKKEYASLYAAIGDTYNRARNPLTGASYPAPGADEFRIPDYRGVFLRGVGASVGYDAVALGAFQDDATAKNGLEVDYKFEDGGHTHRISQQFGIGSGFAMPAGGTSNQGWNNEFQTQRDFSNITSSAKLNAGDKETRPVNVGVHYLIRVTN